MGEGVVGSPPLPLRIGLTAPNERLPRAIRMEIDVPHLERHELATTGERFVSDTQPSPAPDLLAGPRRHRSMNSLISFQPKG
jgi:hypothetical protein